MNIMRIIKADCEIEYDGRGFTTRGRGIRLLIIKDDKSFIIHRSVGVRPINYMVGVKKLEEQDEGNGQSILTVASKDETIDVVIYRKMMDLTFDMEADTAETITNGTEKQFQEWLARKENWARFMGADSEYLCRELKTANGAIDLTGRRGHRLVIVEVKRRARRNDVYQVLRYREAIMRSHEQGDDDSILMPLVSKSREDDHNGQPDMSIMKPELLADPECWLVAEDAQKGTEEFCKEHDVKLAVVGHEWRGETEANELAAKTTVGKAKRTKSLFN